MKGNEMENPTSDLSKFGYREVGIAAELLKAYSDNPPRFLGDGVRVWFNMDSGYVFLSDGDYNVGMLNNGKLEQWHSCPQCGHEGFLEDMEHNPDDVDCQEYLKDINGG